MWVSRNQLRLQSQGIVVDRVQRALISDGYFILPHVLDQEKDEGETALEATKRVCAKLEVCSMPRHQLLIEQENIPEWKAAQYSSETKYLFDLFCHEILLDLALECIGLYCSACHNVLKAKMVKRYRSAQTLRCLH